MMPLVTIVIPFYNDPYVDQAIASALAQTYPHVEIIVVDDGSTCHADRIQPYMHRVHYLGKANGGTASALNHGIRMASGEYIAWLSSDDRFYPHKLAHQIPFMLAHGSRISYTAFDLIDAHGQVTAVNQAGRFPSYGAFVRSMTSSNPVNGCTVVARRDLLHEVGLFNESLPYTHDYDLWLRLLLSRVPLHFLDQSLIQYRAHAGMGTMLHRPVIEREIAMVQARYAGLLHAYAAELGG